MDEETGISMRKDAMDISENVNFLDFASERQKEIIAMTSSIMNPETTKLIFQKLPPHMRRRVMSHNAKRLPIRLREGHLAQLAKSGLPPSNKRPSRYYRRRPKRLMIEYTRRQKTKKWLETHIWHAKRFHMTERWGYKLADAPCDKAFRAAFRATSEHCLLQDLSYYSCIQLSGSLDNLLSRLKTITNPEYGYTFASKAFIKGNREGNVEIVNNKYPNNAIGRVKYLWKPDLDTNKTLWLFIHPSYYSEILQLLLEIFNLTHISNPVAIQGTKENVLVNNSKEMHLDSKSAAEYRNNIGVKLMEIKNLNRFRLTGPLANAVLSEALKVFTNNSELDYSKPNWTDEYFKDHLEICNNQSEAWNSLINMCTSSELQSHMVMGVNIMDPRLIQNRKRTKALPIGHRNIDIDNMPENIHHSALWCKTIRENIVKAMLSHAELCKMRNKLNLVPGEDGYISNFVQGIPILLIQRPGLQVGKIGYSSGWDILIPPNYAMSVWLAFIMRGARAGGLRDTINTYYESQKHYLAPDTKAGQAEEHRIYKELRMRYFKKPPAKRINYIKIGINSPFKCHWQLLVNEWEDLPLENFQVLREITILKSLQQYLNNKQELDVSLLRRTNYLIPVSLVIKKGICKDYSIICIPKEQDMKSYKNSEPIPSIEKIHKDENQAKRINERKMHLNLLKKNKRKRIKIRKLAQIDPKKIELIKLTNSEKLVKPQMEKMQQLWLPETITTVRYQCSRQVMGYVTKGGFSFIQHSGMCLGYVTLKSLISLHTQFGNNIVLVRNTTSRKYLFAKLSIIQ